MKRNLLLAAATALLVSAPPSLTAEAQSVSARDYLTYSMPPAEVCNLTTTSIMNSDDVRVSGMGVVVLGLPDTSFDVNYSSKTPFTLSRDGKVIASLNPYNQQDPVMAMPYAMFGEGDGLLEFKAGNYLYLLFDVNGFYSGGYDEEFTKDGVYVVTIPDGGLKKGSTLLTGTEITYMFGNVKEDVKYTVSPEAPEYTSDLAEITITFPGKSSVMYYGDEENYFLKGGGKSFQCKSVTGGVRDNIKFKFDAAALADAPAGTYKLSIPEGWLSVSDPFFDGSESNGNVQAIDLSFTVKATPPPSAREFLTYSMPPAEVCNLTTTSIMNSDDVRVSGMGVVVLGLPDTSFDVNYSSKTPFTLSRDGKVIASLNPYNQQDPVMAMPYTMFGEGDGLLEFKAGNYLYLLFDVNGFYSGGYDEEFTKDGVYVVTIPDGGLKKGSTLLAGTEVTFLFGNVKEDVKYTVSPEAPEYTSDLAEITITFPGKSSVMYYGDEENYFLKGGGKSFQCKSVTGGVRDNIKFKFDAAALADAPAGTYKLSIPEGWLSVSDPFFDGSESNGNVQAIDLTFTVQATPAPAPELKDLFSHNTPADDKCTGHHDKYYLSHIVLNLHSDDIALDRTCAGKIQMWKNGNLLKELSASDEAHVIHAAVAPVSLDETRAAAPAASTLTLLFADSEEEAEKFGEIGEYKLVIPDGLLTSGGQPVKGTEVSYVADVELGVMESGVARKLTVVSIDGSIVLTDADAAQLGSLAPGIYVVNGKKVVIR